MGFTQYIPDDFSLMTTEQLQDTIKISLGGRCAEELFFNTITTGASDDLQKVSNIARNMVMRFGMSNLGLRSYAGSGEEDGFSKPYSEAVEKKIDLEVQRIVAEGLESTRELVRKHKAEIEM